MKFELSNDEGVHLLITCKLSIFTMLQCYHEEFTLECAYECASCKKTCPRT